MPHVQSELIIKQVDGTKTTVQHSDHKLHPITCFHMTYTATLITESVFYLLIRLNMNLT
jgi:hypothetical protein